jgi:alpha-ribazole phosphatase/probable phosphoglycerate mutase
MKLWFEAHSTSIDNERGIASGHRDAPLSGAGCLQAAELGRRYAERSLRIVYTSDLTRAVSTAEIAFAGRDVLRVSDERLRECDYGRWSGCPVQQLNDARQQFIDDPFPEGESFRDVVSRVQSFLRGLSRDDAPILLVAHRAPWYALEHLIRGRDLADVVSSPWAWQPGWEYDL